MRGTRKGKEKERRAVGRLWRRGGKTESNLHQEREEGEERKNGTSSGIARGIKTSLGRARGGGGCVF